MQIEHHLNLHLFEFRSQIRGNFARLSVPGRESMFSRVTPLFARKSGKKYQQSEYFQTTSNAGDGIHFTRRIHTGEVISNHPSPGPGLLNSTAEAKAEKSSTPVAIIAAY